MNNPIQELTDLIGIDPVVRTYSTFGTQFGVPPGIKIEYGLLVLQVTTSIYDNCIAFLIASKAVFASGENSWNRVSFSQGCTLQVVQLFIPFS